MERAVRQSPDSPFHIIITDLSFKIVPDLRDNMLFYSWQPLSLCSSLAVSHLKSNLEIGWQTPVIESCVPHHSHFILSVYKSRDLYVNL